MTEKEAHSWKAHEWDMIQKLVQEYKGNNLVTNLVDEVRKIINKLNEYKEKATDFDDSCY